MKTQFYILLSLKTPQGFSDYGQYFLGSDPDFAAELFSKLIGDPVIHESSALHIDLMETVNELPTRIKSICCTLDELGSNCKLIALEIFRAINLEDMK
jgi:hypothetical protein